MTLYTNGRSRLDGVFIDFNEDFDMPEANEKTESLWAGRWYNM